MTFEELQANVNAVQYKSGKHGHYESFFVRGNHPSKPLAFWIRYTIFQPNGQPEKALGELWAILFDGEHHKHVALKAEYPLSMCRFDRDDSTIIIGDAVLTSDSLIGKIMYENIKIHWELAYNGNRKPLFLFPPKLYTTKLPKAKSLVSLPFAVFNGFVSVNNERLDIKNWVGSQNHNWGSKHTDHYAWGQVCGFDNEPEAFLELATAQIKIGPVWTPFMTPIVLRYKNTEYALNTVTKTFGRAHFGYFHWKFCAHENNIVLNGSICAAKEDFVCLPYYNPPGGIKYCLNTKIASCKVTASIYGQDITLQTVNRAAFEILTDDCSHGLKPIDAIVRN